MSTTHCRFFSATATFACLAVSAFLAVAQAPTLGISAPSSLTRQTPHGPAKVWRVLLSNNYRARVTAYALVFDYCGRSGGKIDDSVPGKHELMPQLPSGGQGSILLPGASPCTPTVTNTAVIYADGATAGQASVIHFLLHTRAVYLAESMWAISRLRGFAADPAASQAGMLAAFQQQETGESALLAQGADRRWHEPARVTGSVLKDLQMFPNKPVQTTVAGYLQMFESWQLQLQDSLPKLQPVALPPGS